VEPFAFILNSWGEAALTCRVKRHKWIFYEIIITG